MATQYKLFSTLLSGTPTMVQKISANEVLCIPFDPANTDFVEYQRWLAEGHVPTPADEQPTE